ncbi:tetratricopeptide repeat protein [Actinomadura fulvescens]|uniref:Tetratricopeptide repeat protein n=1 Tax=Actinomadura fulvescens TaxID=46160 RepID=A0ABN3PIA9_9ACTN
MTSSPADMAFALLREGRAVEAQELIVRELQAVEARQGRGGAAWTSLQCDLGNVLINSGQPGRAVECFRAACAGPPPADPAEHKDYLTYRLNLGLALQAAGQPAEAEAELRRGAEERLAFYGREHAGYAFGLEPLADVLLANGDPGQARQVADEALANFWNNGHERTASALALRAEIMSAEGVPGGLFQGIEQLPDELVEQTALTVLDRAGRGDPRALWPVVTDLVAALEARLGPDHQATLNALSMLANLGRDAGDPAGRVAAIRRVMTSYERQGRLEDALMAAQGLAMAYGDAGDEAAALRTYADALALAERVDRPELTSQILRNWGLALSEAKRPAEAEPRLADAVTQARRGADPEMLGRALIALGLFLQHQERLTEAMSVTREGLALMDPAHPDAVMGSSHLGAMERGQGCGCGDLGGAVAEAFRQFVIGQLPRDLLLDFSVEIVDGDFKLNVELRREPTEGELEQLDRIIQTAHAEFRRRLSART